MLDRYLQDGRGWRVDRRSLAALVSLAWMLAIVPLCLLSGAAGAIEADGLAVAFFALGFFALLGGAVGMWVILFWVHRRLNESVERWRARDLDAARVSAQRGLRLAFRGDFRTKAFHLLGLCAESDGAFGAAVALFDRALRAVPTAAAPQRKSEARSRIEVHRALAFVAEGRADEADAALDRAGSARARKTGGIVNALLDDSAWGVGAASPNGVLESMEPRDIAGLGLLCRALVLRARGAHAEALSLLDANLEWVRPALLPHEVALLDAATADCRGRLEGAFRAEARIRGEGEATRWAQAVLRTG